MSDFDIIGLPFLSEEIGTPLCAETDPEMFFPQEKDDPLVKHMTSVYYNEKGAKKVCDSCPYKRDCLVFALKNREIGIWGGTTEGHRKVLLRQAKGNPDLAAEIELSKKR